MPEVRVQGSRAGAPSTLNQIERFEADFITRTDTFTADEVLAQVTADLPDAQQVVLIDGRETQVDISTIPAEMIDHIEVSTTGEMPDGRPRVVGNVINIILKQDYNGVTFSGRQRDSLGGGGGQSQVNASGGRTRGKFSTRISFTHRQQEPLRASDRDFSRNQDHSPEGGSDYRAPYGQSAVVQAVAGALNGLTDSNGAPTSIALAPDWRTAGPLTVSDFLAAPAATRSAAGLRHFNTADFLYIIAPSSNNSVTSDLTYAASQETRLSLGYAFSRSQSHQSSPPPITRVGPANVVPAAYNPFGQDIEIGLVHSGFGPVQRNSSADRQSGYFAAEGRFNESWTWNGRFDVNHRVSDSDTDDLDAVKFAAALASADPAQRFNPFADTGPGSANAALYPGLTTVRRSAGTSDDTKLRLESDGELSKGWIAPLTLRLGVERSTNDSRQHIDPGPSFGPPVDMSNQLESLRANASLDIPAFRVRELGTPSVLSLTGYVIHDEQRIAQSLTAPASLGVDALTLGALLNVPWFAPADQHVGVRELQTQVGVGIVHVGGGTHVTESVGALWSPDEPLTFRAQFSRELTPTPARLYPLTVDYNQTLIDRLRANAPANGIEVVSGQPEAQAPPLVTRLWLSAQWMPSGFDKLKLTLTYSQVSQEGQQRTFSAQDILDNEAALPTRVTRLPPTAPEVAQGLPGEIVRVDVTPFSGGKREDRSLSLRAQYRDTIPDFGTVTWRAGAGRLLSSTNELFGGIRVVSTSDQELPPKWRFWTQADWKLGKWSVTSAYTYVSDGQYAGLSYSSFATLDARVAYEIDSPFGGRFGSTLRIGAGIQNLLDRDPPFANTLTGFRGGSPLGRTYEVTLRVPLGSHN